MNVNTLFAQAADASAYEDQTVDNGSFDDGPAPAGPTTARFVGYVEVGLRKQKDFQGQPKPPCQEVRVYFELNGKKHRREVVVDGVTKTFTNTISVKLAKKTGDKATFAKLLKKMTYGRDSVGGKPIKHIAQLLGEAFIIDIVHNVVPASGDKKERTYANMRGDDGSWLIRAPMMIDPETGDTAPLSVPPATQAGKLLLWNTPSPEQWASIFIDGTRTVKDAKGVESEQSKNWLQDDIATGALDFEGSALQAMLGGLGDLTLSAGDLKTAEPDPADKEVEKEAAPTPSAEPKQVVDAPVKREGVEEDDVLGQLGL